MAQIASNGLLAQENVTVPAGSGTRLSTALIGLGALGLLVTLGGGFAVGSRHALASFHVGVVTALSFALGAMFWVMVFSLTQAGWTVTVRRQFENVMMMIRPMMVLVAVFVALELTLKSGLCSWLNPELTDNGQDPLYQWKSAFLNPPFVLIRLAIYFFVWWAISRLLWRLSTQQDLTGNKWLTNKARFHSAWGMLAFALTSAFFAFDWLMALTDYKFFSTMWGVYFFSGAAVSSVAVVTLVLAVLRRRGRLKGLVTEEHLHDLGKLLVGFTVFWAYIAFFQYFLIWYGNIPEETAFYIARQTGGWQYLGMALCLGHFAVPFLILLWRGAKRNMTVMVVMSIWLLVMHVLDLYWVVRPAVYAGAEGDKMGLGGLGLVVDIAAVVGVLALFAGLLVRKVGSGPLTPLRDPRLDEAIEHCNWV